MVWRGGAQGARGARGGEGCKFSQKGGLAKKGVEKK